MTRLIARDNEPAEGRRGFLRGAGAFAATALAPGVTLYAFGAAQPSARAPGEPVSAKVRWGMLIDINKCGDGCDTCVTACNEENGWGGSGNRETDAQWIRKVTLRDPKTGWTVERR